MNFRRLTPTELIDTCDTVEDNLLLGLRGQQARIGKEVRTVSVFNIYKIGVELAGKVGMPYGNISVVYDRRLGLWLDSSSSGHIVRRFLGERV